MRHVEIWCAKARLIKQGFVPDTYVGKKSFSLSNLKQGINNLSARYQKDIRKVYYESISKVSERYQKGIGNYQKLSERYQRGIGKVLAR